MIDSSIFWRQKKSILSLRRNRETLDIYAVTLMAKWAGKGGFVEHLSRNHRYRMSKIDCLRFVMCPVLAPAFQGLFFCCSH
jgi:hypothetical protein